MEIGNIIAQQMGGVNRLRVMLGAQLLLVDNGLRIKWPNRQRSKGNMVEVVLLPSDTYRVTFYNVSRKGSKVVKKLDGVYNDQLVDVFERQTGWYLRM